jgi:hypothetical protein
LPAAWAGGRSAGPCKQRYRPGRKERRGNALCVCVCACVRVRACACVCACAWRIISPHLELFLPRQLRWQRHLLHLVYGRDEQALEDLGGGARALSGEYRVFRSQGDIHFRLGNFEKAASALDSALIVNRKDKVAYIKLAKTYVSAGETTLPPTHTPTHTHTHTHTHTNIPTDCAEAAEACMHEFADGA